MKPRSKEEYEAEIAAWKAESNKNRDRADRLENDYREQARIIQLLTVAGFLSEEKLEQARELARGLK